MLPRLMNRYCDRIGLPERGRAPSLSKLLHEKGCSLSRGAAYHWFRSPDWVRPSDEVRALLVELFELNDNEELEFLRIISAGPEANAQDPEASQAA
ncbi:MAG: hypothetical protein AAFV53_39350 [Myxococcota bacterium]